MIMKGGPLWIATRAKPGPGLKKCRNFLPVKSAGQILPYIQ